jgi:CRP-like cAMP-binding protein
MTISSHFISRPLDRATQHFTARSLLPPKSGQVWRIESGIVRSMTWLEDGTNVVLGIWGAGNTIGKPFSSREPYQLECVTRVEATPVPLTDLTNFSEILLNHLHQTEALMEIRSYKRVDLMLLQLLGWLAQRFGQEVEQGILIDLRFTHLDLADAIGSTRVTVTRTLSQLQQNGMIECLPLKRIIVHEERLWHYEI